MERVGHYEIVECLGRGGMGVVYKAWDPAVDRFVALKAIHFDNCVSDEEKALLQARLRKEAKAAGCLSHPNIVTVHHLFEAEGTSYLVMEFVSGRTLEAMRQSSELESPAKTIELLQHAASALDYAHSHGVIHRDIKPSNILVHGNLLKILDFGIAKHDRSGALTATDHVLGTPFYMSPEQAQALPLTPATDQFSLAVVAFQVLTGRRPFPGETLAAVMTSVILADPVPAHEANPALPERVTTILNRALSKSPAARYPSCSDFIAELREAAIHPGPAIGSGLPITRPRRRTVLAAVVLTCVAVFLAGGLYFMQSRPLGHGRTQSSPPASRVESRPTLLAARGKSLPQPLQGHQAPASRAPLGGAEQHPRGHPNLAPNTLPALKAPEPQANDTLPAQPPPEPAQKEPARNPVRPTSPPTGSVAGPPVIASPPAISEPEPRLTQPVQRPDYTGPRAGVFRWTGQMKPDETVTIEGPSASDGKIGGARLPGLPVKISVRPDFIQVAEPPSAKNGWNKVILVNRGPPVPGFFVSWELRP